MHPSVGGRRRRGPGLGYALLLGAVVEIVIGVLVAEQIGAGLTILLLVVCSIGGLAVARRSSAHDFRALQRALRRREQPAGPVADGMVGLLAAALLVAPGFLSTVLGAVLLLPGVHHRAGRFLMRRFAPGHPGPDLGTARGARRADGDDEHPVIDGTVLGERDDDEPPGATGAGGSRGR